MDNALIISSSQKSMDFFMEMLTSASVHNITTLQTCREARRLLMERDFDLVIINAPLQDESGENLSRYIAAKGFTQVILVVRSEYFDEVSSLTEEDGVLTIAKPINRAMFWAALKLAKSTGSRLRNIQTENSRLKQKIEDIRIIDRAKCILISYLNMSEHEAHRYIEKQAMDMRVTKRAVAEGILKTYEN